MRSFFFLISIILFCSCNEKELSIKTITSKEITSVDIYSTRIANNQKYFDLNLTINENKIDYIFEDLRATFNPKNANVLEFQDRKGDVDLDPELLNEFLENIKIHSTSNKDDQMFETVVTITTKNGSIISKTRDIEMIKNFIRHTQNDLLKGEISILVL